MEQFIRGETVTDSFDFPFDFNLVEKVVIVYNQGRVRLEKEFNRFSENMTKVFVRLNQTESLNFKVGKVEITCIVKFKDGSRIESAPLYKEVLDTNKEGTL